jgi:hypothetical protein
MNDRIHRMAALAAGDPSGRRRIIDSEDLHDFETG